MTPQIALAVLTFFGLSPSLYANESPSGFKGCADRAQDISEQIRQALNEGHPPPDPALQKALRQAGSHCLSTELDQHQEHVEADVTNNDADLREADLTMGSLPGKEQQIAEDNPLIDDCRKHLDAVRGTREYNWRNPCKKAGLTF